jgi:hypothetical protein
VDKTDYTAVIHSADARVDAFLPQMKVRTSEMKAQGEVELMIKMWYPARASRWNGVGILPVECECIRLHLHAASWQLQPVKSRLDIAPPRGGTRRKQRSEATTLHR